MTGKLEVSFNSPQCGWMSIGFEDGVNEFHTTTAHAPHAFALAELMQILTRLADPGALDVQVAAIAEGVRRRVEAVVRNSVGALRAMEGGDPAAAARALADAGEVELVSGRLDAG
jgi:hypothetical protein